MVPSPAIGEPSRSIPTFSMPTTTWAMRSAQQGRLAESVSCYEQALRLKPDNPQMHLSRSLSWLQMGDFERGWPEYEWRLKCKEYAIPSFAQPRWDGTPLEGRTILLYADHGLGDTLQFIRYAPLVQERGGPCDCGMSKKDRRPAGELSGSRTRRRRRRLCCRSMPCYAPLMSLPLILGTTLELGAFTVPYLEADPAIVDRWRAEVGPTDAFKIGVVWQGNPQYRRDRERSFRLAELETTRQNSGGPAW